MDPWPPYPPTYGLGLVGTGVYNEGIFNDGVFNDVGVMGPPVPPSGRAPEDDRALTPGMSIPSDRPGFDSQLTITTTKPDTWEAGVSSKVLAGATMIMSSHEQSVEMMYAPSESTYANLAQPSAAMARPGRQGLIVATGEPVPELSFTLMLGWSDPGYSVEVYLRQIRWMATTGEPVGLQFGDFNPTTAWLITAMTENHKMRNLNGNITRCEIDITLTALAAFKIQVKPMASTVISDPVAVPPIADTLPTWLSDQINGLPALARGPARALALAIAAAAKKRGITGIGAGDLYDATTPPTTNPNNPPPGARMTFKEIEEALRKKAAELKAKDDRKPFAGIRPPDPDPHDVGML